MPPGSEWVRGAFLAALATIFPLTREGLARKTAKQEPSSLLWPLLAFAVAVLGSGCGKQTDDRLREQHGRPQRIVSIDYCADQYVLRLVERERILAVSPDARRAFSYMRAAAAGLPSVRPVAEDVIVLKPDLVVRSYGGGPQAAAMFERAGLAVHQLGWVDDFPSILGTIREAAAALGSVAEGRAVVDETLGRLARLSPQSPAADAGAPIVHGPVDWKGSPPDSTVRQDTQRGRVDVPSNRLATSNVSGTTALYMTPGGVTSGPGSLIHAMFTTAGLQNFQTRPGWRAIPLERLAYEQPNLIAAAFFDGSINHPHAWSPARHPVAQSQLTERPVIPIAGAWTACGGWFLMDAVEALSKGPQASAPGR